MVASAPARTRHVPQRTCIGCRSETSKRGLVRIVRGPDLHVHVDSTGKANGRGAYICAQRECWVIALKGSTIAHALRFAPPKEDIEALRAYGSALPSKESETP